MCYTKQHLPTSQDTAQNMSESQRKSTAKRSPSILVTDVRSQSSNKSTAPFAGAAQTGKVPQRPYRSRSSSEKLSLNRGTKFSNISVSNILSNASEIPSAMRRHPPSSLLNESHPDMLPHYHSSSGHSQENNASIGSQAGLRSRRQINSVANRRTLKSSQERPPVPTLIQALPPRTSKTSQKLVYIPDNENFVDDEMARKKHEADVSDDNDVQIIASEADQHHHTPNYSQSLYKKVGGVLLKKQTPVFQNKKVFRKAKAEIKKFNRNKDELPRVTAYFISDAINLEKAASFLKRVHKASARLYDEVLYVPYQLPLLEGVSGYRVRSNIYLKNAVGKANVDEIIDKSEQRDYHFEYYSGQENEELMKVQDDNKQAESIVSEDLPEDSVGNRNNSDSTDGANNYVNDFKNNDEDNFDPYEPQYFNYKDSAAATTSELVSIHQVNHAEVFLFNYGVIVFWNFTKSQEENILADLSFSRYDDDTTEENDILISQIHEQDIETEEFHFEYDKSTSIPRIYNDMITLKTEDHLIKMSISHAIAQSTKLCRFESRMSEILYSVSKLPKILALTGQLGINREQLLRKSGKLFKLRVDVNLSSNVLDTPEFFWSFEPSLNPLYTAARDYLEIDERVEVINDRCKVFLEFTDVISESIAESNMNKITWIIIIIIGISLLVSCLEIFVRYRIISHNPTN